MPEGSQEVPVARAVQRHPPVAGVEQAAVAFQPQGHVLAEGQRLIGNAARKELPGGPVGREAVHHRRRHRGLQQPRQLARLRELELQEALPVDRLHDAFHHTAEPGGHPTIEDGGCDHAGPQRLDPGCARLVVAVLPRLGQQRNVSGSGGLHPPTHDVALRGQRTVAHPRP